MKQLTLSYTSFSLCHTFNW